MVFLTKKSKRKGFDKNSFNLNFGKLKSFVFWQWEADFSTFREKIISKKAQNLIHARKNYNMNTRVIKSTIEKRIVKQDKNDNDYLIIDLDNGESIFCFPSQEINLDELLEGNQYEFTVKEGRNSANVLVSFASLTNT
ncbi:MAG: hypothetical protein MRECE_49c009 [Mycoplasmataceae bacterium CE_OT135]|nr:MAG: hypothetical protein MRECE_49c009 [Mycoplasmataceae bacterium CE_OT135]